MPFWKPHALAKPHTGQIDLRTGDKVRATVDLAGVPEGTEGKVILANGFNWFRYRVKFTNGAELGDLDHRNHRSRPAAPPSASPKGEPTRCDHGPRSPVTVGTTEA